MPKVFISYSHDSPEHSARVLEFANALLGHGVDAELDQYRVRPEHGWPHWCEQQLREENAEFVLLVCTETYRERVENRVPADEGRGVYWEGAIIYDYLYEAKANRRFIPILLDGAKSDCIPRRIRNHTHYSIAEFDLDDDGYQKLYRELTQQRAVVRPSLGERIALGAAASIRSPLPLPVREVKTPFGSPVATARVSLEKLPASGLNFLGREAELKLLDEAWADAGRTHIVVLVAAGGVGKTGLVNHWLDRLRSDGWRGAGRVYGWSFFSQGTSDDRQASDDPFFNDALRWFGVEHDPKLSPWDKGRLLAEAVAQSRSLLLLDGLEPLQYPPGPQGGELRAPGVQALLLGLVRAGQPGLCVVTTREAVRDLAGYERKGHRPAGGVLAHDLGNLDEADGARLLHRLGVTRAGAAAIAEDDAELRVASRHVRGHALALTLLGGYLKLAHGGDIRKRDLVRFEEAAAEALGGHAFKVMEAYETWFLSAGEQGALKLAAVRLLGLFDRPADPACLAALRAEPVIAGLTEPLVGLRDTQWTVALQRLAECGLVYPVEGNTAVDAHPLVREYFATHLRDRQSEAWREGHRRLYEYLKSSVPHRPDGLAGLQPLYQAVAHGCKAGLHQKACDEVYFDRILRGTGPGEFYSTKKLGAFGADLGAIACFFEEPWERLAPGLSEPDQAWLLNQAAFRLRALGRLTESLQPMRTALDSSVTQQDWKHAATCSNNLSELELELGNLAAAERDADQSVQFADRSGDGGRRILIRTTLADARHQSGARTNALTLFREAESIQAEREPEYPLLYSLQGFRYCDLLLGDAERMAWATSLASGVAVTGRPEREAPLDSLREIERRAAKMFQWRAPSDSLLTIALDHLNLGRVALYRGILGHSLFERARDPLTAAVNGLRASGFQDFLPSGFLSRGWLRFLEGDPAGATADLNEAWQIAERGGMKLHMADILLHRARLFRDRAALEAAARLIEETGYHRRDEELADARQALETPAG